jgi:hypothetical protein
LLAGPWPAAAARLSSRDLQPPPLELPFVAGSRWVVVAFDAGRRPDRAHLTAVGFQPLAGSAEDVLAPAAGRVRLIDLQPTRGPAWCAPGFVWSGAQVEVQLDLAGGWTVSLGYLDDLAVGPDDQVSLGQRLGTLSRTDCDGLRALQVALWRYGDNGAQAYPFSNLSGYRDADLSPGREVDGVLPRTQ